MSMIQSDLLLGQEGGAGYVVERSLRFSSSDSAYLSRTPSVDGNRKTWTFSFWFKLGSVTGYQYFLSADNPAGSTFDLLQMDNNASTIAFYGYNGSSFDWLLSPDVVFRDPSAWQHFVIAFDTTQSTASNRVKWWHNGNQLNLNRSGYTTYPSLNHESRINNTVTQRLSDQTYGLNSYLADIHFIDSQALTPSAFGEFDTNNVWQPKAFSGSYGTNGFHLDFADNSTAAALGTDTSGNSNTWTVNNLSVAAGAGNDSLVDTPTSYGTDTGAGGEVRGNYATFNAIDKSTNITLANGNLDVAAATSYANVRATLYLTSGKWYWELTCPTIVSGTGAVTLGVASSSLDLNSDLRQPGAYSYWNGGRMYAESTLLTSNSTYTGGDIIGFALDQDANTLSVYKNGVLQTGSSFSGLPTSVTPVAGFYGPEISGVLIANFGQRPFAYAAPSGFKALCATNLPAPVVAKPSESFQTVIYIGTSPSDKTVTGVGFSPDFVWIKSRNQAYNHVLYDTVRGATKELYSNTTGSEATDTNGLKSFDSDGFTLGSDGEVNDPTGSRVAWCWDAGSSTVTNTQGSITSQVRANASAGFSIATFNTGASGVKTVGHGLNVAPQFFIIKSRSSSGEWAVYHSSIGAGKYLKLESTVAAVTDSGQWVTAPTSSVFTFNSGYSTGTNRDYVGYFFAPVAGYSSFGSYTGNGSADGPFVYTGFRPRWMMVKRSDSTASWQIYDTARGAYNVVTQTLAANESTAESGFTSGYDIDLLSNGFKPRTGPSNAINTSGGTYIYAAFAEHPFATSRAR